MDGSYPLMRGLQTGATGNPGETAVDFRGELAHTGPQRLIVLKDELFVEWRVSRENPEPIWLESIKELAAEKKGGKDRSRFFVPLKRLTAFFEKNPQPAPFLTIYHVSRCGSTLLARCLEQVPGIQVAIEPILINGYLGLVRMGRTFVPREFRTLIEAIALAGGTPFLAIKATSTWLFDLELIRSAGFGMSEVLLHRNPLEVLVSNMEGPPSFLRAQTIASFGARFPELLQVEPDQVIPKFLELSYRVASEAVASFDQVIGYPALVKHPRAVVESILGREIPESAAASISRIMKFHSKLRGKRFSGDSEEKIKKASPRMHEWSTTVKPGHHLLARFEKKFGR